MEGWIKLHRKILDNPIVCKDSETLSIWIYLLLNATHKEVPALFKGKKINLQKGQLLIGIISISKKLKINKDKVQRTLKCFEVDKQIEQQTSNKNRLITILNWNEYQDFDKEIDKQMINKCETTDKQLITNNNVNNVKNVINNNNNNKQNPTLDEINNYIKEKSLNVKGEDFYNYFTEGKWIDSKGNKVKNWKQKFLTWDKYGYSKQNNNKQTNFNNSNQRAYDNLDNFYANGGK